MASIAPLNPRPMLQSLINKPVSVRLKWNKTEYRGRLVSVDSYMNLQLGEADEFIDGKASGSLGMVLIRCNNVLWISEGSEKKGANGDVEMNG